MTDPGSTLAATTTAAKALRDRLDEGQRAQARYPYQDESVRRQWTYVPRPRPGICLADLDRAQHKAAMRLLATALSRHAYAQAATIMALEEVLDRKEGGHRGRHLNDFWVALFGDPDTPAWGWRFEGHHLSVTMMVSEEAVSATPCFLGAHPAAEYYGSAAVLRPLGSEEDLARALLEAMTPAERGQAVVADTAPPDIRTGAAAQVIGTVEPVGVPAGKLGPAAAELLGRLAATYLDRLPADVAAAEAARVDNRELHFAWEGPLERGHGHYYRVQAPGLLIEYDNTANDANHAHSVLRRPGEDFGAGILPRHYNDAHG